jgi:excisionase family DNA binding protein
MNSQAETRLSGDAETPGDPTSPSARVLEDLLMVPGEAANYLRISVATLLRFSRNSEIPGVRIGKLWRYRKSALDEWVRSKVDSFRHPCRK